MAAIFVFWLRPSSPAKLDHSNAQIRPARFEIYRAAVVITGMRMARANWASKIRSRAFGDRPRWQVSLLQGPQIAILYP
jgi:hypothetical protein